MSTKDGNDSNEKLAASKCAKLESADALKARNASGQTMSVNEKQRTNASDGSLRDKAKPIAEQDDSIQIMGMAGVAASRKNKLSEKDLSLKDPATRSVDVRELLAKPDKTAQALVEEFGRVTNMPAGAARDADLARVQELADKTYGRGKYAPGKDDSATATSYKDLHIHEAPARNAGTEIPSVPASLKGNNKTILNVQISNVPEVSQAVTLDDVSQYAATTFAEGAKVSHDSAATVINKLSGDSYAVNNFTVLAITGIGDHFAQSPNQLNQDVSNAASRIADGLAVPMTPEERAKKAGAMMPMFIPGNEGQMPEKEAVEPLAQRLQANEALRNSSQFAKDMEKVGVTEEQIAHMFDKSCPLGFKDAEQFAQFKSELSKTLCESGLEDATIGMKGTSTTFYSESIYKKLGHHFDALPKPSDCDLDISSSTLVKRMQDFGFEPTPDAGVYKARHVLGAFPPLEEFCNKWARTLQRPVNIVGYPLPRPRAATDYIW
ncbi:MAG: hypothetical protein P4L53_24555 [Candidatus Obscuribacterales bacterium]|nr:hypothetical protein [Candidatus Obscuribacterales bacterium]